MMKKLWWLALLILALVLAGCGQAEPSPVVPSAEIKAKPTTCRTRPRIISRPEMIDRDSPP